MISGGIRSQLMCLILEAKLGVDPLLALLHNCCMYSKFADHIVDAHNLA